MPTKYTCKFCNYETIRKSSYNDHLISKKHMRNMDLHKQKVIDKNHQLSDLSEMDISLSVSDSKLSVSDNFSNQCRYCGKQIKYLNNVKRHENKCKSKVIFEEKQNLKENQHKLFEQIEEQQEILQKQKEKLEKLKEYKEDYMELLKQIAQSKTKCGKTINMFYIINNFTDAYNYEDLMAPALTGEEKKELEKLEPLSGSIFVIENRCITNIDIKKRPIHCLDTARDKYLLRTKNSWVVDHKAKKIFSKVSQHIYKHYLLDPQNPKYNIDKILNNQQKLLHMEGKSSQMKLIKDLNDKVYIKNIKLE